MLNGEKFFTPRNGVPGTPSLHLASVNTLFTTHIPPSFVRDSSWITCQIMNLLLLQLGRLATASALCVGGKTIQRQASWRVGSHYQFSSWVLGQEKRRGRSVLTQVLKSRWIEVSMHSALFKHMLQLLLSPMYCHLDLLGSSHTPLSPFHFKRNHSYPRSLTIASYEFSWH